MIIFLLVILFMPLKVLLNIALILYFFTGCIFSKKAPPEDYSQTIYVNPNRYDSLGNSKRTPADSILREEFLIKKKYARQLGLSPDSIKNINLYKFLDTWMNTPYLWGGTTKKGIDCSAFMQRLLAEVYYIKIPRTSYEQFFTNNVEPFGSRHYLSEGDLVFFRTMKGKAISHVGFYLGNDKFVNAASSKGVSFGNLNDPYWRSKYVAAGRVVLKKSSRVKK